MGAKTDGEEGVVVGEGRGWKRVWAVDYHAVEWKGTGFTPSHVPFMLSICRGL